MARVTVEDCIQVVNNRYELVLLAAQRARDISAGSPITIARDNDKNPVVALREIADQTISLNELRQHIATGVNRMGDANEEDELLLALSGMGLDSSTAVAIESTVFDTSASLGAAEDEDLAEEGAEGENADGENFEDFSGDAGIDLDMGSEDALDRTV